MATKSKPGTFDCYNRAEQDEEFFVLLGRDRHAAALVQLWAEMREREGEDPLIVDEARQIAERLAAHARSQGKPVFTLAAIAAFAATLQPAAPVAVATPATPQAALAVGEIVVLGRGQPGKLTRIFSDDDPDARGKCNVQFPRMPGPVTVDYQLLRRATGDEVETYRLAGGRL
jgi:hypothetical protein